MKDIKNIAIYGSCVSKDPFTTRFNKDYKKKYNCVITDQRHSFISTMQEKEKINESELISTHPNRNTPYEIKCIKEDLQKTFLDLMLLNDVDYLIFDINIEVQCGVLSYNGTFLTDIPYLKRTDFYSNRPGLKHINAFDNPTQFFEIWCENCDKFFNWLKVNCPETKVILIEARTLDIIQRSDSSTYIEPIFTFKTKISNIYNKKLEKYIKENFDVYVVSFHKDTVINENHVWGKWFAHFDDDYYTNVLKSVDKIVEYDELKKQVESLSKENESLHEEISFLKKSRNEIQE